MNSFFGDKAWVLLLIVGLCACTQEPEPNAMGHDTGETDLDADFDQPAVDMPQDLPIEDSRDQASDFNGESDSEPDLPNIPEPECICADPLATCHARTGECVREDIDCSTESCPVGFECITPLDSNLEPAGHPICLCDGPTDICGPFCDENQNCPGTRFQCDTNPQGGVCRVRIECQDDYQCGPGKVCTYVERVDEKVCVFSGQKADGEACIKREECSSRRCIDDVCTPLCHVNTDCELGEVCIFGHDQVREDSNGCIVGTCSAEGCDESNSVCIDYSGQTIQRCDPRGCEISGDCEGGDCILDLGVNMAGQCDYPEAGEQPACKPGEFRAWDGDPYCRLPDPCWSSSSCGANGEDCHDCPAQYDCLFPDTNFVPRSVMSFCSRLVE